MTVKPEKIKPEKIRIGTRGSKLALWQARTVRDALLAAHAHLEVEIIVIQTSGDWKVADGEASLPQNSGGKAQFAKEIEEALLSGAVDIGVHSMKDMDSVLPDGLVINHMLPREDARDALIIKNLSKFSQNNFSIPNGMVIGTVSPRRAAFLLELNPSVRIVPLRGNVETRLQKLYDGVVDATLLAVAGLKRLGLAHEISHILEIDTMIPCAGQGAIGIEMRQEDIFIAEMLDKISCSETVLRVKTERSVLKALGGSCHTSIGVYATLSSEGMLDVRAKMVAPDGSRSVYAREEKAVKTLHDAEAMGFDMGVALKKSVPMAWLS